MLGNDIAALQQHCGLYITVLYITVLHTIHHSIAQCTLWIAVLHTMHCNMAHYTLYTHTILYYTYYTKILKGKLMTTIGLRPC